MRISQCYIVFSSLINFWDEINWFDNWKILNNNLNNNAGNSENNNNVLQMITTDDIREFKSEFYTFNMNLVKRIEIFQ